MQGARIVLNPDGTLKLVDINGEPMKMKFKIGDKEYENLYKQDLTISDLYDIKNFYGLNIINLDEYV